MFVAEVAKLHQQIAVNSEKADRMRDVLQQKLAGTEKDLQLALKQEQQAHEEDLERLTKEKVSPSTCCTPNRLI